jgi:hypothetical protein
MVLREYSSGTQGVLERYSPSACSFVSVPQAATAPPQRRVEPEPAPHASLPSASPSALPRPIPHVTQVRRSGAFFV